MKKFARRLGSIRRLLLVQLMVCGTVLGCFAFVTAVRVSAHTGVPQSQAPAQTPTPATQQKPAAVSPEVAAMGLPDSAGKDTVVRVCTRCHIGAVIAAYHHDRQGWDDTITKMNGIGAEMTDPEYNQIIEYLVKNFPPLPPSPK
jgi:competence protein ComEA